MKYMENMAGTMLKIETLAEEYPAPAEERNSLPSAGREAEVVTQYGGLHDNRGVGVVEVILILVVLIALVLVFKSQLTTLVNTIFKTITTNANSVLK